MSYRHNLLTERRVDAEEPVGHGEAVLEPLLPLRIEGHGTAETCTPTAETEMRPNRKCVGIVLELRRSACCTVPSSLPVLQ